MVAMGRLLHIFSLLPTLLSLASWDEVAVLWRILRFFELVSGLRINWAEMFLWCGLFGGGNSTLGQ